MRFAVVIARLALASLFGATPALAQATDAASAELLFSEGRAAFDAGDYFTACQKFEESQRLDPAAGTLINLAACHEQLGRLASAWESWREALRYLQRRDDRYPVVEKRVQVLESRLPRLEVQLAAETPRGSNVTRDGIPLGPVSLGVALPVDPGKHIVIAVAPNHAARQYVVVMREGETKALVVEPGKPLPLPRAGVSQLAAGPPARTPTSRADATATDSTSRRTLGYVIGGIGVIGLATGAVTGLIALDRKNTVREKCEQSADRLLCDEDGVNAAESGSTFATVSSISFAVGAVATGAGVWLIVSSGGSSAKLGARPLPGGVALGMSTKF